MRFGFSHRYLALAAAPLFAIACGSAPRPDAPAAKSAGRCESVSWSKAGTIAVGAVREGRDGEVLDLSRYPAVGEWLLDFEQSLLEFPDTRVLTRRHVEALMQQHAVERDAIFAPDLKGIAFLRADWLVRGNLTGNLTDGRIRLEAVELSSGTIGWSSCEHVPGLGATADSAVFARQLVEELSSMSDWARLDAAKGRLSAQPKRLRSADLATVLAALPEPHRGLLRDHAERRSLLRDN